MIYLMRWTWSWFLREFLWKSMGKRVMSELDFAAEVLPTCTKILAVTGTNGKSTVATFAGQIGMESKIAVFKVPSIALSLQLPLGELKAIGTHNYYNAAVAALSVIGLDLGIDGTDIRSTIGKLRAPPHRMEIVHKDIHKITWVDDSKATNVDATHAGLAGIQEQKSIILLGGLMKVSHNHDSNGFDKLIEPLKYHRGVITFGSSSGIIHDTLCSNGITIPCLRAKDLKDAASVAKPGDFIVLSPGCASFDEFRNFEHRGNCFKEMAFSA